MSVSQRHTSYVANRKLCVSDTNMCCRDTNYYYYNISQRQRLYVAKTKIICCKDKIIYHKDTNYMLQIQKLCVANTKYVAKPQTIYHKDANYMLQIQKSCVANTNIFCKATNYISHRHNLHVTHANVTCVLKTCNLDFCV